MIKQINSVLLKDVSVDKGAYGISASAVEHDDNLYNYLRITDISDDGVINKNGLMSVDDVKASKYLLKENDIVFARTGNSTGRSYFYDKNDGELVYAGYLIKFSLDENKINPKYMKYYTLSEDYHNWINSICTGSTRKNINAKIYGDMPIILPSRKQQDFLVSFLSKLDKKIEINKKINHNLEEQIVSIFKNWFFNFEGHDNLVESQIGLIPKGWNVDYLGSGKSCFILGSGIDDFLDSKIYIATADVVDSTIINHDTLISMKDKPSRANMQPVPKSIWFAKMIDSRKLIMVDDYSDDLLENYVFSTGFCGIKCVEKYFYYIWSFILTDEFETIKNNYCTGTTMMAINNKDVKKIKFVLPDDETLIKFNKIANPIFEKIYYNNLEIIKLTRIRDALLPKLMSGEIDVSNIKI